MENKAIKLNELENLLNTLKNERELYKTAMSNISDNIKKQIKDIICKYGKLNDYNFDCDVSINYYEWFGNPTESRDFRICLGQINVDDNAKFHHMFHSTFELTVDRNYQMSMNCGTSGSYNKKDNPEQVNRALVIANLWMHSDWICDDISKINMSGYNEAESNYYEFDEQCNQLEKEIELLKSSILCDGLSVGNVFVFNPEFNLFEHFNPLSKDCKPYGTYSPFRVSEFEIIKMTDDNITFKVFLVDGKEVNIRRDKNIVARAVKQECIVLSNKYKDEVK